MDKTHAAKINKKSLKSRLFVCMLLLAAILICCIFTAMILLGQFTNIKNQYFKSLNMQLSVMERELSMHYDNIVISTTQLSKTIGHITENILSENQIEFDELNNRQDLLVNLQDQIFEPLKYSLLQAHTSGAYVILDATVNSSVDNSNSSRSGLYLQLNSYNTDRSTVVVYRGDSKTGKKHGAMPHRKWHLEYDTSNINDYQKHIDEAVQPIYTSLKITPACRLPGTNGKASMTVVPIIGKDGTVYGLCGFEIEQMFFKESYSQPSTFDRLTCVFLPMADEKSIECNTALSCGTQNGYYLTPPEHLVPKSMGKGLVQFVGKDEEYVGVIKKIGVANDSSCSMLAAFIPKDDYDSAVFHNNMRLVITGILLLFFTVTICLIFSRHFISPVVNGLEQIHKSAEKWIDNGPDDNNDIPKSGFKEIDELASFMKKQLENKEGNNIITPYMENLFTKFIELTSDLTPSEMNVLSLMIEGHDPKDLADILFISESTVKHHVLKIYKKLGVSSRGELQLYIEMLKGCGWIEKIGN